MSAAETWLAAQWAAVEATALRHGVHPLGFGLLYLASWPPYLAAWAWLIARARRREGLRTPLLAIAAFFLLPYLYLLAFGRDLPLWVYAAVLALLLLGGWQIAARLRRVRVTEGLSAASQEESELATNARPREPEPDQEP